MFRYLEGMRLEDWMDVPSGLQELEHALFTIVPTDLRNDGIWHIAGLSKYVLTE